MPNIDWNNEDHVSLLTAHRLRLYLKQHNSQVSGGKATLVARVLRYVRAAQQILEPKDNDATSDSELQSSSYSLSQTLMSNALQYKASKGFRYIYYICRWWLEGGRCVIIFGRFGGGSELICLC